ncbi:MAG: hypothetical protein MJ033_07050 [Victivallaceae bacterium]|nr:hypothetical protein [Victivallaceae bacterium]
MKKLLIASLVAAGALAGAIEFRIEGEHLPHKGAWADGGQNSAVGTRVATSNKNFQKGNDDANKGTGTYGVPAPGKYFVWVRTLDFGEGYRKTQIKINGQSIGKFGDGKVAVKGKPEYKWKRAMLPVELTDKIALEAIPFAGVSRLDSIIFTQDENFKPSDDAAEVTDSIEEMEALD